MVNMGEAKPFVKWAGGKTQIIHQLTANLPAKYENYHEPFVGGGALLFYLYNRGLLNKFYIYDYNDELMNAYRIIKNSVEELIRELSKKYYSPTEKRFYEIRSSKPKNEIEQAARFIYLNKI